MSKQFTGKSLPKFLSPAFPKDAPPELITAVENAALNALDRHGVSAFAAPREAAIAHEASHAIVGTHEGLRIRQISIYSQAMPSFGVIWGGRCMEADATWRTGPDTSAEEDLRRARFIVAGLAGEAVTKLDKPGSSLDELALSQTVGLNAAMKLADPMLSDTGRGAYAKQLWNERVWGVAIAILFHNREPFMQLAGYLDEHERVKGGKLREVLAQVKRIAAS